MHWVWWREHFITHFWRSSGVVACCFWPVFPCHWVLGWWSEESVVCVDLPRTIFMTLVTLYEKLLTVCSPWINGLRRRLLLKKNPFLLIIPNDGYMPHKKPYVVEYLLLIKNTEWVLKSATCISEAFPCVTHAGFCLFVRRSLFISMKPSALFQL